MYSKLIAKAICYAMLCVYDADFALTMLQCVRETTFFICNHSLPNAQTLNSLSLFTPYDQNTYIYI